MSIHIEQAIAELMRDVDRQEVEVAESKRVVNRLCAQIGRPPAYASVERPNESGLSSIVRDQWYGQSISTAIREYLAMRKAARVGPATVNEIYDALVSGGYAFDAKDPENAKRGIRICLTKNTLIFHRLPDGTHYGLLDWYPEAKTKKEREPTFIRDAASAGDTNGSPDAAGPAKRKKLDDEQKEGVAEEGDVDE